MRYHRDDNHMEEPLSLQLWEQREQRILKQGTHRAGTEISEEQVLTNWTNISEIGGNTSWNQGMNF